jgi:nucleotide-binding universal stress UspA family protein
MAEEMKALMATEDDQSGDVIVWFEDTPPGHRALSEAHNLARATDAHLTVVAVATHERVVGCGRCLQGTVLWNLEMKKIAHEELLAAQKLLEPDVDVSFELMVGTPADSISAVATSRHAFAVVLPWQRNRRFDPPHRREVGRKIAVNGPWKVIVSRTA